MKEIPTLHMLTMSMEEISERAQRLYDGFVAMNLPVTIEMVDGNSEVGGGSMPLEKLPTKLVSIHAQNMSANQLAKGLRDESLPVICRINEDRLLIDPRTIKDSEVALLHESSKMF